MSANSSSQSNDFIIEQGPLLGEARFANTAKDFHILPSAADTVVQFQSLLLAEPTAFRTEDLDWEEGFQGNVHTTIATITEIYLLQMRCSSLWTSTVRVFQDIWYKNKLLKTLQAMEHLLQKSHTTPGLMQFLDSNSCVLQDYGRLGERSDNHDLARIATARQLNILAFMMFRVCEPPSYWDQTLEEYSWPKEAISAGAKLILGNDRAITTDGNWKDFTERIWDFGPKYSESPHWIIDPLWMKNPVFHAILRMYWSLACSEEFFDRLGSPDRSTGLENILMNAFRNHVSDIIGVLKSRLDNANSVQNKMLSLFTTAAITFFSYLMRAYDRGWIEVEQSVNASAGVV